MASDSAHSPEVTSLIIKLHSVDAIKFGDYTLKSGMKSPVYFDLRVMISYPSVMSDVAKLLWEKISSCKFQSLCGVPYTALPIATLMSVSHDVPMLIKRKEAKSYGTKKLIEGKFSPDDLCMIVEDVVSSGSSVLETAQTLQEAGIRVTDAVVLLNREQGGPEKLSANHIKLHSVFSMSDVLSVLSAAGKMSAQEVETVSKYIAENKFKPDQQILSAPQPKELGFGERSALCKHPVSRRLFRIMEQKQTNLVLSADVTSCKELLDLVEKTGPFICMVKTHADILTDFSQDFVDKLKSAAAKHNFLIFEDRKFADIGNTVVHQFQQGVHKISSWADVVNAHPVPGPGVLHGLKKVSQDHGCLLIAEMSSAGNLATGEYTQATVKMAEENSDTVIGFICQTKLSSNPAMLHMTPGVQLSAGQDNLGQQYLTPQEVISNKKCDVIIVGRGIYAASDPKEAARQFQWAGYEAYLARLS